MHVSKNKNNINCCNMIQGYTSTSTTKNKTWLKIFYLIFFLRHIKLLFIYSYVHCTHRYKFLLFIFYHFYSNQISKCPFILDIIFSFAVHYAQEYILQILFYFYNVF